MLRLFLILVGLAAEVDRRAPHREDVREYKHHFAHRCRRRAKLPGKK